MLRFIPIPQLSAVWPAVRAHIQRANDKLGERNTPEEFYHALRQGLAGLYLAEEDAGIFICQKVVELDGTATCFIWLTVGPVLHNHDKWHRTLESLAQQIGAVRLRMRSPRKGWERATNGYWKVAEMTYEHELDITHERIEIHPVARPLAA